MWWPILFLKRLFNLQKQRCFPFRLVNNIVKCHRNVKLDWSNCKRKLKRNQMKKNYFKNECLSARRPQDVGIIHLSKTTETAWNKIERELKNKTARVKLIKKRSWIIFDVCRFRFLEANCDVHVHIKFAFLLLFCFLRINSV